MLEKVGEPEKWLIRKTSETPKISSTLLWFYLVYSKIADSVSPVWVPVRRQCSQIYWFSRSAKNKSKVKRTKPICNLPPKNAMGSKSHLHLNAFQTPVKSFFLIFPPLFAGAVWRGRSWQVRVKWFPMSVGSSLRELRLSQVAGWGAASLWPQATVATT